MSLKGRMVLASLLMVIALGHASAQRNDDAVNDFDCGKCDGFSSWHHQIENGGGLCLDAHRPDMAKNGGKVQVWTCVSVGQAPQYWHFKDTKVVNGSRTGQLINDGGRECLDVDRETMTQNGAKVQVWNCTEGPEQQWFFRGKELVNVGSGKCLAANKSSMHENGAVVQVWACNKMPEQQWTVRHHN